MMKIIYLKVCVALFISTSLFGAGDRPCINPFKTIDWSYLFDGSTIGSFGDTSSQPFCLCDDDLAKTIIQGEAGIKMVIAEPIGFIEITNHYMHFPCISGRTQSGSIVKQKGRGNSYGDNGVYRNAHFISYAPFEILNMDLGDCFSKSNFSIPFIGEIEPIWSGGDDIASILNPESLMINNPIALSMCGIDCISPRDDLSWCNGCWHTMKNGTGRESGKNDMVESISLASRVLDNMHKTGRLKQTHPANTSSIFFAPSLPQGGSSLSCNPKRFFKIVKSQYAFNLAYPTVGKTFKYGTTPIKWENYKKHPLYQAQIYTVWRKRSCCMGIYDFEGLLD